MPVLTAPGLRIDCEAIVFDKDGTLIDQRPVLLALGRERFHAIRDLAGARAAAFWAELVGFQAQPEQIDPHGALAAAPARDEGLLAAGAIYRSGLSWLQSSALAAQAYALADQRLLPPYGAVLLPGVEQSLMALDQSGFRMAIATTDRRQRTMDMMQALGVLPLFDALITVDDVKAGKPAPEMLLQACRRMDLKPDRVAVVGDTETDMRMGKAAGSAVCIGVRTGMNRGSGLDGCADVVLDSVAQLCVE